MLLGSLLYIASAFKVSARSIRVLGVFESKHSSATTECVVMYSKPSGLNYRD